MATDYPKCLHESRLDDATPAASTTATGYDVLNLRDFRPYTWWKPIALPATVTVNCGSAKASDYWMVYGHDLYTQGCTVELRASTDNFAASDVLIDSYTPTSNDPFVRHFASVSYRYWRLKITGAATMPSLAIFAVGVAMDIPAYLSEGFDPVGRQPMGGVNRSELGHPIGRTTDWEQWSETLNFPTVSWSWARSTWLAAWEAHLRDDPFVFQWDPTGHADEVYLVSVEGGFKTPHQAGGYCTLSFNVTAVAS